MKTNQSPEQLIHLYARAGFGLSPKELIQKNSHSIQKEVEKLIKKAKRNTSFPNQKIEFDKFDKKKMVNQNDRQKLRAKKRQMVNQMNTDWIQSMATTDNPLLERMSLFWHSHFACRIKTPLLTANYMAAIRSNALGNFRDLLFGVSKSAAMIRYLNNQQNKKQKPNENFAREVMELFTIGRGNYTENDIKEAAKAFTGWTSNLKGEFILKERWHDESEKNFMGTTGNFGGEDIINIILARKETAVFIVKKIYQYFVNEKINEKRIENLANYFYKNDYDIAKLMQNIFTSSWFYEKANIGTKIKSPIDLLVGVMKIIDIDFKNNKAILFYEKALGQILFNPPNVAGWQGGKAWIDNSTLLTRLNFVSYLFGQVEMSIKVKEELEANMRNKVMKRFVVDVSANKLVREFSRFSEEALFEEMSTRLVAPNISKKAKTIDKYTIKNGTKADYIKSLAMQLMSLPEYQLC
jgi:uncharacterized protein (DUF1800 family)